MKSRFRGRMFVLIAATVAIIAIGATVVVANHDFSDVPNSPASFHDAVSWLVDRDITSGCGGGKYCPKSAVTREQMALFLQRFAREGSPRAFGFVSEAGARTSGSTNWSATWNAGSTRYEITISGENYFWTSYTTTVTLGNECDGGEATVWTNSVSGKLLVHVEDSAGARIQCAFQFATFKY